MWSPSLGSSVGHRCVGLPAIREPLPFCDVLFFCQRNWWRWVLWGCCRRGGFTWVCQRDSLSRNGSRGISLLLLSICSSIYTSAKKKGGQGHGCCGVKPQSFMDGKSEDLKFCFWIHQWLPVTLCYGVNGVCTPQFIHRSPHSQYPRM